MDRQKFVFKPLEQVTCCKHLSPKLPEELATTSWRKATLSYVDLPLQDLYPAQHSMEWTASHVSIDAGFQKGTIFQVVQ